MPNLIGFIFTAEISQQRISMLGLKSDYFFGDAVSVPAIFPLYLIRICRHGGRIECRYSIKFEPVSFKVVARDCIVGRLCILINFF
jgi:hypothetical protein